MQPSLSSSSSLQTMRAGAFRTIGTLAMGCLLAISTLTFVIVG